MHFGEAMQFWHASQDYTSNLHFNAKLNDSTWTVFFYS